jgi:hypothetical protein
MSSRAPHASKYLRDTEEPSHWPKKKNKKDKTTPLLATSTGKVELVLGGPLCILTYGFGCIVEVTQGVTTLGFSALVHWGPPGR